ncbi:tRNA pseudouridine(38-40) synthase TruA [Blastococcus sp. Marseille-P5729]|uniref:tRNA pseudouridine(38-40) synthase TruA n=1 Tax=Blastococcus sp. Marseille-P5729 TaxID=2086582 RepID=UPI000D0EFCD7|nr:tRNA pseudouridine(38-40) synthase TruA [Blastococcus sp. Marseille-P5729]
MPSSNPRQEPVTHEGGGLLPHPPQVRLRLEIAYDGTDFSGWAPQPDRRTVCGILQTTLRMILRRPVRLVVAGRTDAGVHASGQVAHLDLPAELFASHERLLLRRLAGLLPPDVRVTGISEAPPDFDARFSGLSRSYAYRISDREWGVDPLRRQDVVHWPRPLDTALMQAASEQLRGLHDFAAYCKRRADATTIRTLLRLDWGRERDGVIRADVQADAFCHSMVRSLVGALVAVGEGRKPVDWPAGLLARQERSSEIAVAPAKGLTLVAVEYPPDDQLAARNRVTRNRRDQE